MAPVSAAATRLIPDSARSVILNKDDAQALHRAYLVTGDRGIATLEAAAHHPAIASARRSRWKETPNPHRVACRVIEDLHEGAFAPVLQQPLIKALLLPFITLSGAPLADYLVLASF